MEWTAINTGDPDKRSYQLMEEGAVQMILKYNLLQQSIRLTGGSQHQVFHLETVNRWNTRMVFKNVYGVPVGRFSYSTRSRSGRIVLEPLSLQYAMVEKGRMSVTLYKHDRSRPYMVCDLPDDAKQQPEPLDNLERSCLLLGLGWYCSLFFNNPSAQYQF